MGQPNHLLVFADRRLLRQPVECGRLPALKTLSIPYPESLPSALHLSNTEFEKEARMAMAVKLFDVGKLSSGQAAELAGVPRVHFLYELGRWGVSALQTDEEALENDVEVARRLHDRR